jgi:hypothetical protein
MRAAFALILLGACTSCASVPVPTVPTAAATPTVTVQCLPLKSYTLAEEQSVAAELQTLPQGDPIAGFIADYGAMRSADRACLSK